MHEQNSDQMRARRRSSTRAGRLPRMPSYREPVTFRYEIQTHTSRMQKITKAFQVYRLASLTIICVFIGLVIGLICRQYSQNWTEREFMYIEMPGELYMRMLKLMIVPLLMSNVILSFGSIQGKLSSQLGKLSSLCYFMCNLMAIMVALSLTLLICPGKYRFSPANEASEVPPRYTIVVPTNHYKDYARNFDHRGSNYVVGLDRGRHIARLAFKSVDGGANEQSDLLTKIISSSSSSSSFETTNNGSELTRTESLVVRSNKPELEASRVIIKSSLVAPERPTNEASNTSPQREHSNSGQYRNGLDQTTQSDAANVGSSLPIDIVLDLMRNLVPDNLIGLSLYQTKTRVYTPKELVIGINGSTEPPPSRWPFSHGQIEQANIIGLLTVSIVTGVILSQMETAARPMLELCACISELSLRFNMLAVNLTPICIMFLLIGQVARTRDLTSTVGELTMYLLTVSGALMIHGFILMPLIYWVVTKNSPLTLLYHLFDVLVAALATSSSSATLAPLVSSLLEFNLNPVVVRAFAPLGSVFNMNGTTIYEIVSCLFLAQITNAEITLALVLLVGLTSAVAGLSTVGLPSSGLMTIVIVLDAINLPNLPLGLIYIFDPIIDRFRTVVNVWSGALVCGLIDRMCPEQLLDEAKEHRKFLELLRYRSSKKSSLKSSKINGGKICDEPEPKSQVISVTITPPVENTQTQAQY